MTEFVVGLVVGLLGLAVGIAGLWFARDQARRARDSEDLLRRILDAVEEQHPEGAQAVADEVAERRIQLSPQAAVASTLSRAVRALPDRERTVLVMRFFESMTLAEIGARLGLTREEVRQIEGAALTRLVHLDAASGTRGRND